jgi:hypothetical protein
MERVSWRRRPDGVIEIVRPRWWQRPEALRTGVALALTLLVLVGGFALASTVGATASLAVASLLVAACGAIGCALWRSSRGRRGAATARAPRRATAR